VIKNIIGDKRRKNNREYNLKYGIGDAGDEETDLRFKTSAYKFF